MPTLPDIERAKLRRPPGQILHALLARRSADAPKKRTSQRSLDARYKYQKTYNAKKRETLNTLKADPDLFAQLREEAKRRLGHS